MMSGKARRESTDLTIGVKIIFHNDEERYTIVKEVLCENGPSWNYKDRTEVMKTTNNEDLPIMDKDEQQEAIRKLIPLEMEKYSLLQGESMERLVDLSTLEGLENTINTLADISNLIKMCKCAKELAEEAKKEYRSEEKKNKSADSEMSFIIARNGNNYATTMRLKMGN